jgi:hypothetical protein
VATQRGIELDEEAMLGLVAIIQGDLKEELRACQPRDLINQVTWAARYEGKPPQLDRESLLKAMESYFLAKE